MIFLMFLATYIVCSLLVLKLFSIYIHKTGYIHEIDSDDLGFAAAAWAVFWPIMAPAYGLFRLCKWVVLSK